MAPDDTPCTPDDLIPMSEAERISERSRPTLRRWVKSGELNRWEGESPAHGGSPIALVSRSELLGLLVQKGQQPRTESDRALKADGGRSKSTRLPSSAAHDRPIIVSAPSDEQAIPRRQLELEAEIQVLRAAAAIQAAQAETARVKLEASAAVETAELRGELAGLRAELAATQRQLADARGDLDGARLEVREWKDRHDAREAELQALQQRHGMSWWQRLLSG